MFVPPRLKTFTKYAVPLITANLLLGCATIDNSLLDVDTEESRQEEAAEREEIFGKERREGAGN